MDCRANGVWCALGGVAAGAIVGSGVSHRWGFEVDGLLSSPNFATLLAGLGGASLGGLISYLIAKQSARETTAREARSQLMRERAQALSCFVVTIQIGGRLHTLKRDLQAAAKAPDGTRPWELLQASTGSTSATPTYNPTDFTPFINAKFADSVHRCMLLAERIASIESAYGYYSKLRIDLEKFLLPLSTFKNESIVTEIPDEHAVEAKYRTKTLDKLILDMAELVEVANTDAKSLITEMATVFKLYFGADAGFDVEIDTDA